MKVERQIVVFAAADLANETGFWAGLLGGRLQTDGDWHSPKGVTPASGRTAMTWSASQSIWPNRWTSWDAMSGPSTTLLIPSRAKGLDLA